MTQHHYSWFRLLLVPGGLGILFVVIYLAEFTVGNRFSGALFVAIAIAVMIAMLVDVTVDFVWGCNSLGSRLGRFTLCAGLPIALWAATMLLNEMPIQSFWQLVSIVPMLLVCSQLSLWALRYLFQWRLVHIWERNEVREQWGLRDLIAGTAAIGICLALARPGLFNFDGETLAVVLLNCLALPAILVSPAAWYVLRARRVLTGGSIHVACLIAILVGVKTLRLSPIYRQCNEEIVLASLALVSGVCGAFMYLDWLGYRLVIKQELLSDRIAHPSQFRP